MRSETMEQASTKKDCATCKPRQSRLAALRFLPLIVSVCGCGHDGAQLYPVTGKVTYPDGTPLIDGWVSFRPLEGETNVTARGQVQPDGTFKLSTFGDGDGAVVGRNQVLIMPPLYGDREGLKAARPQTFSRRFSNFATSGLEFTVTDDPTKNQFDIVVSMDANGK